MPRLDQLEAGTTIYSDFGPSLKKAYSKREFYSKYAWPHKVSFV